MSRPQASQVQRNNLIDLTEQAPADIVIDNDFVISDAEYESMIDKNQLSPQLRRRYIIYFIY